MTGFALLVVAGWIIAAGADHELRAHWTGFAEVAAGTGAVPDLNRLVLDCTWDAAQARWVMPS